VSRAINHLFPLEIPSSTDSQLENIGNNNITTNKDVPELTANRSAADEVRKLLNN